MMSPVELRQLEYFVAVARHGTFTRAAEELWITQSALSQQVRRLEEELGVRLLHRTSRGAEPTPAGADLLARAEAVLAELARARADLQRHTGLTRGRARVAAGPADAAALPAALAAFHRAHPGLQVALRHAAGGEVAGLVQRGTVDVGVAAAGAAAGAEGVEAFDLPPEELVALLPAGDALAAGGPIALGDLRERPLVLAEPGSALRAAVLAACQAANFSPVPLFEVSDPASVRHLVHSGLGASVVPASWSGLPGPPVAWAALAPPAPRLRLALLAPSAGLTPAGRALLDVLRGELGAGPETSEDLGELPA